MSNTNLVTKSNELIEARYKLTLYEQRLILLLISIIQPDDDDFIDYELHVSVFAEMFGIDRVVGADCAGLAHAPAFNHG